MKKTIKQSFALLIADRYLLALSSVLVLLAIALASYVVLSVHPSELQLVSHCSAFGMRHLYTDQWFYLFVFGAFGLVAAIAHISLALKLLILKGHSLAVLFVWLGIAIIFLAWMTAYSVIFPVNCWST